MGRVCFLLKLIAGNFPHSSFLVLSLNIFQDLFFLVAVLAGKAIGCFSVRSKAANIKRKAHLHFQNLWMIKFLVAEVLVFFLYLSANKICACTKAVFECTEIKPAKNSDFCDPAGIFFKLGNTEVCVLSDLNHEP